MATRLKATYDCSLLNMIYVFIVIKLIGICGSFDLSFIHDTKKFFSSITHDLFSFLMICFNIFFQSILSAITNLFGDPLSVSEYESEKQFLVIEFRYYSRYQVAIFVEQN